jgi:hypothetical protein
MLGLRSGHEEEIIYTAPEAGQDVVAGQFFVAL